MSTVVELRESQRVDAIETIKTNHYTRSVPSGKSYYLKFEDALIVWSIPANKNIGKFLLGRDGKVWELARLYAPDGHRPNLMTQAISSAVTFIMVREKPDVLVSYADPNVGHHGGVYRAASWIFHGHSERTRMYQRNGETVARRAFHSGKRSMTKAQIEAQGWKEVYQTGKLRFVKPITRSAKRHLMNIYSGLGVDESRVTGGDASLRVSNGHESSGQTRGARVNICVSSL